MQVIFITPFHKVFSLLVVYCIFIITNFSNHIYVYFTGRWAFLSCISSAFACYIILFITTRVPIEIKRREVELNPQVSPEEIMSREVELGWESWTSFASGC